LNNFYFNKNAKLGSTLFASNSQSYDRGTREVEVSIPAFSPAIKIAGPTGTTHFKIVMELLI
tara:strand:+ start:6839 stop:7024 length:186 start_codon:yes stop_codon:yes gene_type:complete